MPPCQTILALVPGKNPAAHSRILAQQQQAEEKILQADGTPRRPYFLLFDLVINLITSKALGLTVPPSLLARADEVID